MNSRQRKPRFVGTTLNIVPAMLVVIGFLLAAASWMYAQNRSQEPAAGAAQTPSRGSAEVDAS